MPWKRRIRLLALRIFGIFQLIQAKLIVIADRATDILLALVPSVPFGLASPIDLACLAAVHLGIGHNIFLLFKS